MKKYLSPAIYRLSNIIVENSSGCWLYTKSNRKILDFTSGIGVLSTGHCHPKIVSSVKYQLTKSIHLQQQLLVQTHAEELSKKLTQFLPKKIDCFFYNTSGSEAIDSSIKLARDYTKKSNIISF